MTSLESVVKDLLRRLVNGEVEEPTGKSVGNKQDDDGLKDVTGAGEAVAMAGLRDAIQNSKALGGLVEAVKVARSLLLQKGSIGDRGICALVRAFKEGNVSNLAHLDLSDNNITEQGFGAFTELLAGGLLSGLESLNISHNLIREEGSNMLARILQIGRLSSLQSLNISHCYIGNEGLKRLANALQSEQFSSWSLQSLDMSANVFGEEGVVAFSRVLGMGRLPYLKSLNLSLNMFGEQGTLALASVLNSGHLSGLTHLVLSRCYLSNGVVPIAQALEAGKIPNLQFLDISYNHLGERGTVALARALRSGGISKLQNLILCECGIAPTRVEFIADGMDVGQVWGLQHLDMSNNFLVISSTGNSMNYPLTSTDVDDDSRVDVGSMSLARLMKKGHLNSLQLLNLSRCGMTDDGLIALAEEIEVGHLPSLQRFLASDNDIRSEGSIAALVRALESGNAPDLVELDLGHNSIGDDVTMALASALEDATSQSPIVKNLKEKLWKQKSPVESVLHQLLKFLEMHCGLKLTRKEGRGRTWNEGRKSNHLMVEDEEKESASSDKRFFNICLVCIWFLAVLVSYAR